jgi:hypothetical protein
VIAGVGAAALGCGGKKGTIQLDIVVSPLDDPFTFAAEARFTVGPQMKSVPVTNGHFDFSLDQQPPKDPAPVIVEALDSAGNVIGHGQTPPLSLAPVDQGPFAVWVGRPGTVAAARAVLPAGRTEMAAFGATGLGAMFAGGRDASGAPLANTAVYDVFTHQLIKSEDGSLKPMSTPRAGAAAVPSSPRGIVFGGAQSTGLGTAGGALSSGELFDPSGGGLWAAVPSDSPPQATYAPNTIVLGSGSGLVSGGLSAAGTRITSALLISTSGTVTLTPLMMPMVAARARHAVGAARFPDGDGALLIGGLADGDPGPVVERLIGQAFTTFTATGVENRWDASATGVPGGVLLVGGTIPDMTGARTATTSVVFLPTETTGTPMRFDTLLPTPRAAHTATKVGDDLLLCGGIDATGAPVASCEVIGTNPIVWKRTLPTGTARTGHVAVALETGPVLIAGGVDASGAPVASIEIFTP